MAYMWLFSYCCQILAESFDGRYLCAYIKSYRSDAFFVNAVEATFAVIYLCLWFSAGLNFSIKFVSYDYLKILLSSRLAKTGIILKLSPPHIPIRPSTSISCSSGCWICCLQVFNLFLSIVCVCPIYSSLQSMQIIT